MKKVLLIRPLCTDDEPEFAEPLGIERIAGYLMSHGVEDVRVFDRRLYTLERRAGVVAEDAPTFYEDLRSAYGDCGPDIVGLSLMTADDVPDARRIIGRLRSWWPEAVFTVGGVFVTGAPDEAARILPRDVLLQIGEGEGQMLALARSDVSASDLSGAEGGAPAASFIEPDEWACAYRPHLEHYARLGCAVNMQTSRGCPGSCTFCTTPLLPEKLRRWRPRSIGMVVDEIAHEVGRLRGAGLPPVFNFVDDDFGSLERIEDLVESLSRRGLRISFALEMRLASLVGQRKLEQRLVRLREGGLSRVFFGLESLNPATLATWRKPDVLGGLPAVIDAFRESGVCAQVGYILWHGAQTPEGACREVERLHELGIYTHKMGISRLIVFPGCALGKAGRVATGFQAMHAEAEGSYRRFSRETAELTARWTSLAIAEPYAAAICRLDGDASRICQIQRELEDINEQSYRAFIRIVKG